MTKQKLLAILLTLSCLASMLAVAGVSATAETNWQDGTNGVGKYQAIDQAGYDALGDSIISGMTPTLKSGATKKNIENLTDGKLSVGDDYAEFRDYYNQWGTLKFDLGNNYDIDNLLIGSPVRSDGGKGWNLRWFRVYVSDQSDNLFTAANLVAQGDRLTNDYAQIQVQPEGGVVNGRFVGFEFWVPHTEAKWKAENPFDPEGDMYSAPNINYNLNGTVLGSQCWGAMEIGELAVFGVVNNWKDGTNGIGQYQAIDQAGYDALGTSIISGMEPTVKSGAAKSNVENLTDGKLSVGDDYAEFRDYYNQWGTLKFDLGNNYDIDNLLIGSPVRSDNGKGWNLRWFRVYVSDQSDNLFTAANLVAQGDRLTNDYAQIQVQPEGGLVNGRFVGFEFWVPHTDATWKAENPFNPEGDMYSAPNINYNLDGTLLGAQCWGAMEIGELAVFGVANNWKDGTNGVGKYQAVDQAGYDALGTSLISGMAPNLKGTDVEKLTDGALSVGDDYAEFKGYFNQFGKLTFDLGSKYDIDNLLVGSPVRADGSKDWNLRWFRVYVSENGDDLFNAANLVAQADKLTNDYAQIQVQPEGGLVNGRFVGFEFWVPSVDSKWRTDNPFVPEGDMYTLPNINYNNDGSNLAKQCWGALEIGELAVFGVANNWKDGTNGIGKYQPIDQAGYDALGTSLINGMEPTVKNGAKVTNIDKITDGSLSVSDDYAEIKSYWGQWADLKFDLGDRYDINDLVIGSPVRGDSSKAWTLRWFRVYVSNSSDNLFDDANLVAQADKIATHNAQLRVQPEGGEAAGRYVGFKFWVPTLANGWKDANPFNPDGDMYTLPNLNYTNEGALLAAECHGALMVGELGVFGERTLIAPKGAQIRGERNDLRFGFTVACDGVVYASEDSYAADYTNGTIKVNGNTCTIKKVGSVVAIKDCLEGEALELNDAEDSSVKDVPANNVYELGEDYITYTAVVMNIPDAQLDTIIVARPYIVYADENGVETTIYGDIVERSYSQVKNNVNIDW